MHILAATNQKGGCGKTTTAINLAAALAQMGQRVLLVDVDPQAHATLGLGINPDFLIESVHDILVDPERSIRDAVVQVSENLDLAPSKFSLAHLERSVGNRPDKANVLRGAVAPVEEWYDFTIIDCPPNVGMLTLNALAACDEAIATLETSFFSLHGMAELLETVAMVKQTTNPTITVSVLATLFDQRTRFARNILNEIRTHFSSKMYSTVIRSCVKLREATSAGLPIHTYDPRSYGAADYRSLAEEVLQRKIAASGTLRSSVVSLHGERAATVGTGAVSGGRWEEKQATPKHPGSGGQTKPRADAVQPEESGRRAETRSPALRSVPEVGDAAGEAEPGERSSGQLAPAASAAAEGGKNGQSALRPRPAPSGPEHLPKGVVFTLDAPEATDVRLVGSFNGWDPSSGKMARESATDIWKTTLPLGRGRYEYRFLVDGDWVEDPGNPDFDIKDLDVRNSVLTVSEEEEKDAYTHRGDPVRTKGAQ